MRNDSARGKLMCVPESSSAAAVDVLANVVELGGSVQAVCMLASVYLERGESDKALHYASLAVQRKPSSEQARNILAKVNVALGDYASALSHFEALATLSSGQRPTPPDEHSIPAHFALHNVEQLEHILSSDTGQQVAVDVTAEELLGLRRDLVDLIDGTHGSAP